jgi:ribosomal protein S26
MKQSDSIKIFDKLNKVINGSKSIVENINNSSSINHEKAIKASMLNSILIAEALKDILRDIVVLDKNPNSKMDLPEGFEELFGGFRK